ncbi:MAG TPA: YggT family protein [Pyrinomonadaceae bacterium]|jgi:YggT family protein
MLIFQQIYLVILYCVTAVIVATVVLMILRLILNYADINPFTWPAMTVRRLSDPLVEPVRRQLVGFGVDPKYAPLITILLLILVGWFVVKLSSSVFNMVVGIVFAVQSNALGAVIGYALYGLLDVYTLLIFIRIIFSWGMIGYRNPVMRFLVNATDPMLVPLRRIVPRLGMMDISPIVAFMILWVLQAAVAGTLLQGYQLRFF